MNTYRNSGSALVADCEVLEAQLPEDLESTLRAENDRQIETGRDPQSVGKHNFCRHNRYGNIHLQIATNCPIMNHETSMLQGA